MASLGDHPRAGSDGGPRLVGRGRELAVLDRLLAQARAGGSAFVVVTGEPGIGKTSLLAALARAADERGCLVLEGRAAELEQELPFGLLVDALDAYLHSLDARPFERLAADELSELAAVFPSLRSLSPASAAPTTVAERFRAHHAVRELIERLAVRQPVVLTLDDVQWSDGASVELIGHLLRRAPEAAVLVAVAFRTGRADTALVSAVEGAAREGRIELLRLGPLDAGAAGALMTAEGRLDSDRLYRESGGNPFYLLQLARSGAGAPAATAWDPDDVPSAVAAAITHELATLPADARSFAQAASVAGDPFEFDLAVAAAAVAEADALPALDELIARDLIRQGDVPRRFQFRHPLVRSAVYASCSAGTRMLAHARCARALAMLGAPATARAHHVEQSARHGDADAVAVLSEAGREAAQRAPSSAARWFDAALRILPAFAPPGERAELLMALAGACAATGRLEEARAALLSTIGLGAAVSRVKLISAIAAVEHLLGRHEAAHERLTTALEELPDQDTPDGAALMIDLALDAFYRMQYEGMRDWAARAVGAARRFDDRPLAAAALVVRAFAGALVGPIREAQADCTEAAQLVDSLADDQLAHGLAAVSFLSAAEFYLERYDAVAAHVERGLAVARATGQGDFVPSLAQALGNVLFVTGRLAEAGEVLDSAVEATRLSDNPVALAWTLLNRAYAAVLAGDVDLALRASEECVSLTRGLESSVVAAWAAAARAAALFEAGAAERAAATLVAAAGGDELPLIPGGWRANWLEFLTRCFLALQRPADAQRAAANAKARADAFGLLLARGIADRALAAVALDAGDAGTAVERALASAAACEQAGARVDAALSRALAGRALAHAGDVARAVAELERSADELEACGAARSREKAERELRGLGRKIPRRRRPGKPGEHGIESLSGRELDVARLVVDRRTNREIAAELFLSRKTVETHLRNIFRKLDAGSRVEVARIVERGQAR